MANQAIGWSEILQLGGMAGVVSAIVNGLVKECLDRLDRRRKAKFLSLRISLIFEEYFRLCVENIYDHDNCISSRGHVGEYISFLPSIKPYPTDENSWLYIDHGLLDEILSFPASIEYENDGIRFMYDVIGDFGGDYDDKLETHYKFAFASMKLARNLRLKNKLPIDCRINDAEARLRLKYNEFKEKADRDNRGAILHC